VTTEERDRYFAKAFADRDAGRAYPFTLIHKESGQVVGMTRLTDLHPQYRNAELGYTWLDKALQGTAANLDSKVLMLSFAFEALALIRVQLNVDSRNERSQAAIRALGATYEGCLRAHQIMRDGYLRDTLVFSILAREWPDLKPRLLERLERKLANR
jgi:N-acetyltransferase